MQTTRFWLPCSKLIALHLVANAHKPKSTFEIRIPFAHFRPVNFLTRFSWLLACALLTSGCGAQTKAPAAAVEPVKEAKGTPQPLLPTVKLHVSNLEVTAEICRTPKQIETGMMWRTNLNEMSGMIFVFNDVEPRSFWMKNCPLPLSCAYIDPDGNIAELHDMKPFDESPIPSQSDRVQYVLEMNQGWFQRHDVKPGTLISSELGTLRETFFQRR